MAQSVAARASGSTNFGTLVQIRISVNNLIHKRVIHLYGAALAHWSLARERTRGTPKVRVYTADNEEHGWQ